MSEEQRVFKELQDAVIEASKYKGKILNDCEFTDFWESLLSVKSDLDYVRRSLNENC